MSVVRIETEIPFDKLLKSVEQLNLNDLEKLMDQIVTLKAKRKTPCIPKDESRLILKINQGLLSPDARKRFNELVARRQDEKLTSDEHQELLHLTDLIEKSDAKRMEHSNTLLDSSL